MQKTLEKTLVKMEKIEKADTPKPSKKALNAHNPARTLGPVSDLERHLPAEWWRNLFGSVYLKTDGDVVENDRNTRREIDRLIHVAGIEPNDALLDLCCGQGRHCLELARRGYQRVTGVDRSRFLVRLARQRAKKSGLNANFVEGDARHFRMKPDLFNCVMILGNSFGYFERAEDDLKVLRSCMRVLKNNGTLVLDVTDGDWMRTHFESRSWEWVDQSQFVCRERSLSSDQQRLISREVVVHSERGVIIDQFYAERLYTAEKLEQLLKDSGFQDIRVHQASETHSSRGQDLGMMAHRVLITARALKVETKPKDKKQVKVMVLLGDPRLPDQVKRNGQFNPEDLDTINRLKKALAELNDFEFEYMDNHATLFQTLRSDPPEFVLNLCDEGYNNDAFKELHVPAVLEMLDVPYSGCGPACLGLCYNKALVRAMAATMDIPVPLETYYDPDDQSATLPATFPALVKPNFGDSSIGITQQAVVENSEALIDYIKSLQGKLPERPLLIQEFLAGNEYSIGIIGNPGHSVRYLPALEVDYSGLPPELPKILGYESKWEPDSPYWNMIQYHEANLTEEQLRGLQDSSIRLFERLGCRDYVRFDFRADAAGKIKLLEVNPNPGWCWDGKLNLMAGFAGLRYADLLDLILDAALERIATAKRA